MRATNSVRAHSERVSRGSRPLAAAVHCGIAEALLLGRKERRGGGRRANAANAVMATNIEQIFRSFVVNKFREIQEEQQQQHGG